MNVFQNQIFRLHDFEVVISYNDARNRKLDDIYALQNQVNSKDSNKAFPFLYVFFYMSLLIGDICRKADVDIEIIATIQLFSYTTFHSVLLEETCPPNHG